MYSTSLEDKDHQSDVIACIYDDVVKYLKKELSLFMKETKMGAKMHHEVDITNRKRIQSKSTSVSVSDPILHSKSKSTSFCDPIISPPIYDSTIETSTIPHLSQPVLTPTNPSMSNTAHLKEKV